MRVPLAAPSESVLFGREYVADLLLGVDLGVDVSSGISECREFAANLGLGLVGLVGDHWMFRTSRGLEPPAGHHVLEGAGFQACGAMHE